MLRLYEYIWHSFISHLPLYYIRNAYLKIANSSVNKNVCISRNVRFKGIKSIKFEGNVIVNQFTLLDGRGELIIGKNVDIAERAVIWSMSHDPYDENHCSIKKRTVIEDYVWIGSDSIVLMGITVGKGAIVASGSVVTKDVKPYSIVAGNPAKEIGRRPQIQKYTLTRRNVF